MFVFKNIDTWELKKVKGFKYLFLALYTLGMIVIPSIIISSKYRLFENATTRVKVTGVGAILLVLLLFFGYCKLKEAIDDLPQTTYKQQMFKFGLLGTIGIFPVAVILIALNLAKDDIALAYQTIQYCVISIFIAMLIDKFFYKFIKAELKIRDAALFDNEKQKRRDRGLI